MANIGEVTYSKIACVGTGLSAIGLGATLQRWYGERDIQYFERSLEPCGTWNINQYPGCGCDVPSVLYSLSYEPNPQWSRVLPSNKEIERYLLRVINKYDLRPRMTFGVEVKECKWIDESCKWRLHLQRLSTGHEFFHECSILFSAAGQLVYPRELDVPGVETFKGDIFHSARWRKDVTLEGKNVVVIGNGCTASQIVPAIAAKTKSLTQIVRSKHWVFPPIDREYPTWMKMVFKFLPGTQWLHRLHIFFLAEKEFLMFPMTKQAARIRKQRRYQVERYMRMTAPEKYHDILIPDFDVGCKRRIFDTGYLKSLHLPNLTLTNEKATEIIPEGIKTAKGVIQADVIIMANGFRTNEFISPMTVTGRGGETLMDHWQKFGGPEAYNCSVLSGFPNFFMILGPNAATGHTSAIMASENTINYALRVSKPVIEGTASTVEIKEEAEISYVERMQQALKKTVWFSGCQSWYVKVNEKTGKSWNAMSYPWSQAHFWYRSLFPVWNDWTVQGRSGKLSSKFYPNLMILLVCILCSGLIGLRVPARGF